VAPGAIVSTYHHTNYAETFPNWDVLYIPNQSWNAVSEWRSLKHANAGKWWMPGEENNKDFVEFVDQWLDHWLGYAAETVFDVNLLMVNSTVALVNNYNREVFAFLQSHGIEPIVTPFRHRFFWDGGIHCITNDLVRIGEVENYF
jgi:alkanesulfonate monooxygenase SsuD/methylene tetrahydromethanopterin reductase-like flavin-dependent oxidoreductase (luciferase family)